MIVIYVVL